MMQDVIFIHNLQLLASIGVFDWEKQLLQKLEVDVELLTDIRPAASSEQLHQTLDYAAISQRLMQLVQSQHHDLIETLAERMAACLLAEFNTPQVTLTLRKPGAVPAATTVGVRICRQRQEATLD
ncbi:dihydroneopterin aldolase [Marinospirillum alkaliphilum]|uniref:7,8-dihydroneopterin aldolase n=1 Tax=Marinospirillum alkaliphilum DSM 21637 TaxID=1122209 RepID=A0A1K1VHL1_9GAMM|nr:dihydroneopterin aldolase [Marinospirillum alkaliphilum]SFX24665.1 dihydroneopterin aldolase [Marinospirillum alkaliphilum DSM 21637]